MQLTPSPGSSAIAVVATNVYGNSTRVGRAVTYTPPSSSTGGGTGAQRGGGQAGGGSTTGGVILAAVAAGLTLPRAVQLLQPLFKCWTGRCQTCSQPIELDQLPLHPIRQDE
jgi:hypothetical protein